MERDDTIEHRLRQAMRQNLADQIAMAKRNGHRWGAPERALEIVTDLGNTATSQRS